MIKAKQKLPGKFIVLEGGEGAGKSTNLQYICKLLQAHKIDVKTTREPGGTSFGEQLRQLLLDARSQTAVLPEAELLLMFAARAQHLNEVIRPSLADGVWVVCDRFTDASYAYQGGGRGLPVEHIEYLEKWVQAGLQPDITLLLDAPVELGAKRAAKRGTADRFEREQQAFFERVRAVYLERARRNPQRYRIIDAAQDLQAVQLQLEQVMTQLIEQWATHVV
jgi:dTMP kinase